MTREVVGSMSEWSGMLKDLFRQIEDGSKTKEQVQAFLEGRNPFESLDYSVLIVDWQDFYNGVFGIKTDFSNLWVPEKQERFDRLIVVAQGMAPQNIFDKCKELFPSLKYTGEDLSKIAQSDRTAKKGAYAVWVRDRIEADKELKNLSADDLERQGDPQITLEERLLYELKYFRKTGKHLDVENTTLCAGSRFSGGGVPGACWYDGRLKVHWYEPGHCFDRLRSRRVVV